MKTIALRFGEHFSPECGTIEAHKKVIDTLGYVWYGKMGNPVASNIVNELKKQNEIRILLIQSGKFARYWAHVSEISRDTPPLDGIPAYYRDKTEKFKTWFKITEFESAPKNILSKCIVTSSGNPLGVVSMHSMSPYFIIEYKEDEVK